MEKVDYVQMKILELDLDSSGKTNFSIKNLEEKYLAIDKIRDRVLKNYSNVIENYLVNEF